LEGIATRKDGAWGSLVDLIEVVDLVWKGLRHPLPEECFGIGLVLKSLTWFGRDCDNLAAPLAAPPTMIEVVDLVWKGLRHSYIILSLTSDPIEVVDLVWKGLRHATTLSA